MTQALAATRRRRSGGRIVRLTGSVSLAALLLGCASGAGGERAAGLSAGSSGAETTTIDPAYTLAPEDAATRNAEPDPFSRFTERAAEVAMEDGKVFGAAVHLSKLYDQRPNDLDVIYDYARHLRYIGASAEAEGVLNNGLALAPSDPLLRLERAKLMIAVGRPQEARTTLEQLAAERPRDPSILQTLGVARDRLGDHAGAQSAYEQAMGAGRPSAALLNNTAMSKLMSGDLKGAETLLRRALVAPGATSQVRQNLALALTLQGEKDEARRIAREGAPASIADAAVSYFATIGAAGHAWAFAADPS